MVKAQILLPTARRDLYLESGTAPQRVAMLRVTETRCYGRSSGRCAGTPRRRCWAEPPWAAADGCDQHAAGW